jgi:dTDP-glucose 4,6-dehydratase
MEILGGRMRAVVTGAAGFLGSHLCDRLLAEGWEVLGLDNFITGREENLAHLKNNGKFSFAYGDVSDGLNVAGDVAYVLHFASPASPPDYLRHPIETMRVGSVGTQNALELAQQKRAKFFLASTSECYGDPEISPQHEEYWGYVNCVGPRSVYDEAKRFSEALTMGYHRHLGVNTRIVRIFNTYGPRMRLNDGRALPNFVFQGLSEKPITVYGDGQQTRSFCYVSDLIDGIYRLAMSEEHLPVNIGNPEEITLLEFAERVRAHFPKAGPIVFEPLPQDDPKRRCPDIQKAKRLLGWEPKVSLAEGLRRTIEYFQEQYGKAETRVEGIGIS